MAISQQKEQAKESIDMYEEYLQEIKGTGEDVCYSTDLVMLGRGFPNMKEMTGHEVKLMKYLMKVYDGNTREEDHGKTFYLRNHNASDFDTLRTLNYFPRNFTAEDPADHLPEGNILALEQLMKKLV